MMHDDERPLPPERMLALVAGEQRRILRERSRPVPLILLVWALAFLIGFLALWHGGRAGQLTAAACLVVAGAASGLLGASADRGRRAGPAETFTGVVYGAAWWLGIIAVLVIGLALRRAGMPSDVLAMYIASAYIALVGLMFTLGAAIWRALPMLVLGVALVVLAAAAPFAGHPGHYLVYAIGGGGAMLAMSVWTWLWARP